MIKDMPAVAIDSNAPFDMLFKSKLNVTWPCITNANEIREASKHSEDDNNNNNNNNNSLMSELCLVMRYKLMT